MNVILVFTQLRPSQNAVLHPNDDGSYTILVNTNKCYKKQVDGVFHELRHISNNDFNSDLHADIIERIIRDNTTVNLDGINFFYHVI